MRHVDTRDRPAAEEVLALNQRLLDAIASGSWEVYSELCDPALSCFEPETCGELVEGMQFHRFYFGSSRGNEPPQTTTISPRVRLLGDDAAVVTYVRLVQFRDTTGNPQSRRFQETRVWHRQEDRWRMVHLHRSTTA